MKRQAITLMISLLLGSLAGAAPPATSEVSIAIARQPMADALTELGRQIGMQVVIDSALARGMTAPAVSGKLTLDQALRSILKDTGLRYEFVDKRTIAVVDSAAKTALTGAGKEVAGMTLAQTMNQDKSPAPAAVFRQQSGNAASSDRNADENPDDSSSRGIPDILVRGRRTLNTDVERNEDGIQPYVVFGREQIEQSMATNLEDFLKTRLPMNAVESTNSQTNSRYGNQSTVNLRGLGTNQTLVLVNGRRLPRVSATGLTGEFNQPDINGIPLSAVERIEVLPATASAIYGGGATGGVLNIVLRQDYAGVEAKASFDNSFDSDSARYRVDVTGGFSLEDGRTHVILSAGYSGTNALLVGDRDFARRGRALARANDSSAFMEGGPYGIPNGYTTNIHNLSYNYQTNQYDNLVLKSGEALTSPITFIPVGYAGTATDGGAALIANAGSYNLDLPRDIYGEGQSLLNGPATGSVALNVRREFGGRLELFADASRYRNNGRFVYGVIPVGGMLAADAPNNPFTTAISVAFPSPGVSFLQRSNSETTGLLGGFIVRLPLEWSVQSDYNWTRSRFEYAYRGNSFSDAGLDALTDGTLDIMRDLNEFPNDYSPYTLPSYGGGPLDTILTGATLRVAGPLLRLPAGPLTVSMLAEHRTERAKAAFSQGVDTATGELDSFTYYPARTQATGSYYMELSVPLIGAGNALPAVQALELQVSLRRDDYRTESPPQFTRYEVPSRDAPLPDVEYQRNEAQSTDYTVGLRYAPVRDLALRLSFATGFLPPSISQVASITESSVIILTDPLRGDAFSIISGIPVTMGGNDALEPETSDSFSAGVVVEPRFLPGLRVSVDYVSTDKRKEIMGLSQQQIVDNEAYFPGRVTRGEPDAGDPPGFAGPIIAFDQTLANIARTRMRAYDIQADYSWVTLSGATFGVFALGSRQTHLERQLLSSSPFVETVGFSDGPLKWRGNAGMTWSRSSWTLGWNARYFDSRLVWASTSSPTGIEISTRRQGAERIPSQVYHDLFVKYRAGARAGWMGRFMSGMEVMAGVGNLLNTDPPIVATADPGGGYSYLADPRMRTYTLSLRGSF